jgi:hypothetical protein
MVKKGRNSSGCGGPRKDSGGNCVYKIFYLGFF